MTPEVFLASIIDPGLEFLSDLGGPEPTDDARRFLLAVALQESGAELNARYQNSPASDDGPAHGWWQFEQGGGVYGVMTHPASYSLAEDVCDALSVVVAEAPVWRALEGHDTLSVCFARLLMLTDPYPIPTTEAEAWASYCDRLWRPGKPHPETWAHNWATATAAVECNPL